jgi:UDP-N-acetylglucosamine 2-epimerase
MKKRRILTTIGPRPEANELASVILELEQKTNSFGHVDAGLRTGNEYAPYPVIA